MTAQTPTGPAEAMVLAAHRARLHPLDRLLAEPKPLPEQQDGDVLLSCPGGAALVRDSTADEDSFVASFTAVHDSRLAARAAHPAALGELLDQWQKLGTFHPGQDDTATVTWPARDTTMSGAFLERGFAPQTILAVRQAGFAMPAVPTNVMVREARTADYEAIVDLWLEEIRWDQQFRSCAVRPSTGRRVREEARKIFESDELWCWIAEDRGAVAGMMVVQTPERARWASGSLAVAPASYLTCGVVGAASRGGGVGYALVHAVHDFLDATGVAASLLHYTAVNPLSAPFWSRCGYRPLMTTWVRGTVG